MCACNARPRALCAADGAPGSSTSGDQNHLHVAPLEGELVTLADPDAGLGVGDRVGIEFVHPLFFGDDGRRIRTEVGHGPAAARND